MENKASLKLINQAIWINFDCINPVTTINRFTWWNRNKLPSTTSIEIRFLVNL